MNFSIITVCLNAQDTIERAISSVRNQLYPKIEYIVIDGGSKDKTVKIVERNSKWVSQFISEPDNGIYPAMNKGMRYSNGGILFFLNADDYFVDSNVLTDVAAVFNKNPDLELVFGNQIYEHRDRLSIKKQSFRITRKQLARMTIQHQTIFTKKSLLDKTGGFSENFRVVSDYEWILKVFLTLKCQYCYVDRNISVMSTSGLSWSTDFEKERIRAMKNYYSLGEMVRWRILPNQLQKLRKLIRLSANSKRYKVNIS